MNPADAFGIAVPTWTTEAACRDADPSDFHPDGTGYASVVAERRAKMICADCPVRMACLDWQMEHEATRGDHYRWGVYGGLGPSERAKLAKQQKAAS